MSGEHHANPAAMRFARAAALLAAMYLCVLTGCAGGGATNSADEPVNAGAAANASRKGSRERELDLVIPPTGTTQPDDLTKLDDATLDRRIAEANQQVNERTGRAFLYAASATEGDLGRDAQYRKLLLEAKLAESELDRLEAEKARRARG